MQKVADQFVFSPSDLNHFLECEHLLQLQLTRDLHVSSGRTAHADLLARKGQEHEAAWLERFRAEGRHVVDIGGAAVERNWSEDARRTLAALQSGADVIYQGVLEGAGWRGISDFLIRTDVPSSLGQWSYEAWDTKLARHSKPYFVLQLCFYSGMLGDLQGLPPSSMHVILGTDRTEHLRYGDFAAYYRAVRRQFTEAVGDARSTHPYPVAHCALCEFTRHCQERWRTEDHLSQVAGITREQVGRLGRADVRTASQLAALSAGAHVPGIGRAALERLRHQATLQTYHRDTGRHRVDLLPLDERSGFRLLPAPSAGDIYFDMEGDPFYEPGHGLEYLFGAVTTDTGREQFTYFQALDKRQEKAAFEQFIDFVCMRLAVWPDLHVYHYAAYETTALKRLMSDYATREDAVDDLLRREVFVDLYQVVRQSMRISHQSYSIKRVRTFFMERAGEGTVADGGDSILEFERWRSTGDPAVLQAIVDYNREDCISTVQLRDWLLEQRREAERTSGITLPWKPAATVTVKPEREAEDAAIRVRQDRLRAIGGAAAELLAHLLQYHRREGKPQWWAYFERQKKSLEDLISDTEAIAGLEPIAGVPAERVARSLVVTLGFPPQEFKLGSGDAVEDPFSRERAGDIAWLDAARGRLGLKRGPTMASRTLPAAIVASKPLDNTPHRTALCRVADAVIGGERSRFRAAVALLAREAPRRRQQTSADGRIQTSDLEAQKALVAALDDSYLFIQGPPGSGKTWTGARLVVSLIRTGLRIGVAATSHKAIHNFLEEIERVAAEEQVAFRGVKKSTGGDPESRFAGPSFVNTDDAKECEAGDADLTAGTSWLFARDGMERRLDYLFIDEAGQVALADAVAMSTAARNVVLLGDPQQLPHVTQGVHPAGSGCSVLEHLLGGVQTVAEDRGLFLDRSWRMHPEVCEFISTLAYDGRLESAAGRERQQVDSPGLNGAGLRYLPVPHDGNAQQSVEEARAIASAIQRLLDGGTFTDHDGRARPLQATDILVVAPFNMHVRCLRDLLPQEVQVGTVDKFQGREAPVVFFSMASSTGEDVPRGLEFLFSRNRFNVAISRARALAVLVCSPRLLEVRCRTVDQMRLVNALCSFVERARLIRPAGVG